MSGNCMEGKGMGWGAGSFRKMVQGLIGRILDTRLKNLDKFHRH